MKATNAKRPPRKEAPILKSILGALSRRRIFHWRNNSGAMRASYKGKERVVKLGVTGSPDVFVVLPGGLLCGLEVKTPETRQTDTQETWQASAEAIGIRYAVVRSANEALKAIESWARGQATQGCASRGVDAMAERKGGVSG